MRTRTGLLSLRRRTALLLFFGASVQCSDDERAPTIDTSGDTNQVPSGPILVPGPVPGAESGQTESAGTSGVGPATGVGGGGNNLGENGFGATSGLGEGFGATSGLGEGFGAASGSGEGTVGVGGADSNPFGPPAGASSNPFGIPGGTSADPFAPPVGASGAAQVGAFGGRGFERF